MFPVPAAPRFLRRSPVFARLFSLTLLAACSLLSDSLSAQMVTPRLLKAAIPSLEAAQRLEEQRPRPIWQVMVQLKAGVLPADFARAFSAASSGKIAHPQTGKAAGKVPVTTPALEYVRSNWKINWHVFRLPSPDALGETLERLRNRPEVLQATMDQPLRLLIDPPNNSRWNAVATEYLFGNWLQGPYGLPGFLDGEGRDYDTSAWHYNWHHEMISSLNAWGVYPGTYPTATSRRSANLANLPLVAILDTGLDMTHPAFSADGTGGANTDFATHGGQIQTELARSFFNGARPANPAEAMDVFGHGTSVAGLIAAAPNNGQGIPGVGFTSRLVPIRVYGANGDGLDSDLVDAIIYAVDAGCVLINISARTDIGYSPAMKDAVDYAWDHNTLVVAAIGNDGVDTNDQPAYRRYPASLDKVLAVGATMYAGDAFPGSYQATQFETGDVFTVNYSGSYYANELPASYTDYGQNVGVVAPGGDGMFFENNTPNQDDPLWSAIMQQFSLPPPSGIGLPSGAVPEFVFNYTTAPTYLVPMNDATDTAFGAYAQYGFYNLGWGEVPGTSFAAPVVTGLAALYAAKNSITQATAGGPQRILQAIQRGADNILVPEDPTYRLDGGYGFVFGWGRINAEATLRDQNRRSATVGGIVGTVTVGGTVVGNVLVRAHRTGFTDKTATTTTDGVFHLVNLASGNWTVSTTALGFTDSKTINVRAGCDTHATDFRLNEVRVSVTPNTATLAFGDTLQFTATVTGASNTGVLWNLPIAAGASINTTGLLRAPNAPGSSLQALVQATSLADTNRAGTAVVTFASRITGTVTLQEVVNKAQTLTFELRPTTSGTAQTITATLSATGAFTLNGVEPGVYNLAVKGAKWLRKVVPLNCSGGNVSGLNLSLRGGDANNDNEADALDLAVLIDAFNTVPGDSLYNAAADFNGDNSVDALDLAILIDSFNMSGDL